jgi:hypothetical protein
MLDADLRRHDESIGVALDDCDEHRPLSTTQGWMPTCAGMTNQSASLWMTVTSA